MLKEKRLKLMEKIVDNMNVGDIWLNCTDMDEIEIDYQRRRARGTRRTTYLGKYRDRDVAVKIIEPHNSHSIHCLQNHINDTLKYDECFHFVHLAALKEIVLLQQLRHPGIMKLLGYCVRDTNPPEKKTPPVKYGIIAVYEYAEKYNISKLNMRQRLDFAVQLADLLDYMEHSPLGSSWIKDFRTDNFMVADGLLKISDIDVLSGFEARCTTKCHYGVKCQEGRCVGMNARRQMNYACMAFFKHLLTDEENAYGLKNILSNLTRKCYTAKISAADMRESIKDIILKFQDINQTD